MSTSICLDHSKCLIIYAAEEAGDFSYLLDYLTQGKEVLVGVITEIKDTKDSASDEECYLKLLSLEGGRFLCQDGQGAVYDYDSSCLVSYEIEEEI